MVAWGPTALGSGTRKGVHAVEADRESMNEWALKRWFHVRRALWDLVLVSGFCPATDSKAITF
jgi:hypothetical protein